MQNICYNKLGGSRRADQTIKSTLPIYSEFLPVWQKCRDAIAGERKIKAMKEVYLPKPSGMDNEDYLSYITRAQFFNAAGRTLDGLAGMLNRKPALIVVPEGMEKYLDNVDGKGHTIQQFIDMVCKDVLTTNWGSVLVDMPQSSNAVSQADVEKQGLYAYMVYYKAEASTKWRWETEGRQQHLKYVILKEPTVVDAVGEFNTEVKDYYRVLKINDDGNYEQILYNEKYEPVLDIEPKSKQGVFKEIPFEFLSVNSEPEEPLLADLVNVNLSHYRKSADYENGLHWTGVPTPYARGYTPQTKFDPKTGEEIPEDKIKLGGTQFLCFPQGVEQVAFLEFSGSGLTQISNAMSDDKESMAILGARIIANQKKGVEAAETAKIHNAAENSVLASFANNMSQTFSKLLRIYLEWTTGTEIPQDQVKVQINTDYDVATMSASELTALVSLWQSGGIAKSDLFKNLKEGEILDADRNLDEMNAEIEEEQASRMPVPVE